MFLEILLGCFLVALSILALPNLFVSKKGELTPFFKKLLLYQGCFGLIALIVGAMALIQCALKIAVMGIPILWLTDMLCYATLATLGFLLSYNLIYILFLSKGEKPEETPSKMRTSIMPLQGKISILGILIGIWSVMAAVMFA